MDLKSQMKYLKPFLVLLEIMPEKIYNIEDETIIDTNLIEMDALVVAKLRKV